MLQKIEHSPIIWIIENFLTLEECQDWVLKSEQLGYQEATVSLKEGAKMMKGIRNNSRAVRNNSRAVYIDALLAVNFWDRLKDYCP